MDLNELLIYIGNNLSTYEIAKKEKIGQTTVRYWLKKYNLKTIPYGPLTKEERKQEKNIKAGKRITALRRKNKQLLVEYKGGKCVKCGYNKCINALDFHHLDPLLKEFALSTKSLNRKLDILKIEADKCILLCANCHRETHSISIPST